MRTDITATEAVRHFSELLNSIKYRKDRFTIIRGGKAAAALVPAEEAVPERHLVELGAIYKTLPRLDSDDTGFVEDVLATAGAQPPLPEKTPWE